MLKTIFFILAMSPLAALANKESGATRFDKAEEAALFGDKRAIVLSTNQLLDMAKQQSPRNNAGVPPSNAQSATPSANSLPNRPLNVPPAPSYRTMADAAKAGVDPLKVDNSKASLTTAPDSEEKHEWVNTALKLAKYVALFVIFYGAAKLLRRFSFRGTPKSEE